MPTAPTQKPRVMYLAEQIEADIRKKKLVPGDPYLTASETARMLSCSTAAVNRALQLLVQRRVLDRKPRKGASVAHPSASPRKSPLQRVYLLVNQQVVKTEGILLDGTIIGMQSELPGVDVQFSFVPPEAGEQHASNLVVEASRFPAPTGLVLIRSSLATQRLMAESGLPVVVLGSLFPSITTLPWLDRDQFAGGKMLAEYCVKKNCKRMIVLFRDRGGPGDYPFMDGINAELAKAGVPLDQVMVRSMPSDDAVIRAEVSRLLRGSKVKTGIIARSEPLANGAIAGARSLGLSIGRDIVVTASDVHRRSGENPAMIPHLVPTLDPEAVGAHLGRMLAQQARGQKPQPDHEIIPVEIQLHGGQ